MNYKILVLFYMMIVGQLSYAQLIDQKMKKANHKYNTFQYYEASKLYLNAYASGNRSDDLFKKLGNTYYFNSNYREASIWYEKLFKKTQGKAPIYYIRYAQTLKVMGKHELAKQYYHEYLKHIPKVYKKFDFEMINEELINIEAYKINFLNINSDRMDYGFTNYNSKYIFASNRDESKNTLDEWSNQPYFDLFECEKTGNIFSEPKPFSRKINTPYHESSPCFTKQGNTMYFTSNGYNGKNTDRIRLKIYKSILKKGKWSKPFELGLNSNDFSNAHPALSPDEKTLFFVSDRPGSYGDTDIYSVRIFENGELGTPQNLGRNINTEGRESFPFVTSENELFFSSDGHLGYGGYDIYYIDLSDNSDAEVNNVGHPINSSSDDFAFLIDTNSKKGFFSSNRKNGIGDDDIYEFIEIIPIKERLFSNTIFGKVLDKLSNEPISGVKVSLTNGIDGQYEVVSDEKGVFMANIKGLKDITYTTIKKGYIQRTETHIDFKDKREFSIYLEKSIIDSPVELSEVLSLDPIYYENNKYNIKPISVSQLIKVVKYLEKHNDVKIEIVSHTDSRADEAYNLTLSKKRSLSVYNFLVTNGINKARLSQKGMGESILKNHCNNVTKCTDDEHEENRRTEFIVIKME